VALAPFVPKFVACTFIQSPVLADFITKWTSLVVPEGRAPLKDILEVHIDRGLEHQASGL
jgi:hypothetical protein